MRTTWLVLAVLIAGCGDEFSVPPRDDGGGGGGCSGLSLTACANNTQCKVRPGCCGGEASCVDKNAPELACVCLQPCSQLGETDCRARTDCKADTCIQCSCTPTYVGCRAKTAAALPCPAVDCVGPACCSSNSDCGNAGSYCAEPGARICGGACMLPEPCMTDLDCKTSGMPNGICDAVPCSCGSGLGCQPGCGSNTDCAEGQTCDATHRCVAKICTGGGACPANFDCVPVGPTELCRRRTCSTAANCDGSGSCVNGSCYKSLGMCEFPRP